MSLTLVPPSVAMSDAVRAALREDPGHWDGAGIRDREELDTPSGFAAWTAFLDESERHVDDPALVTCSYRWIVERDEFLGFIALRHELTPFLLELGGHIGYSVRPSARRRGAATRALAAMLDAAARRRMARVLVTCAEENIGSRRVIEANGGVLEDVRRIGAGSPTRRYWIDPRPDLEASRS